MTPRDRILHFVKGKAAAGDARPLFFPLVHSIAARVEEIELSDFLVNPTKLAKGLVALNDTLEADAIVCCCAAAFEAEAMGAALDWSQYPPQVVSPPLVDGSLSEAAVEGLCRSPRLASAVEATRRLAATVKGGRVLVAALTGPMTLARQIAGAALDVKEAEPTVSDLIEIAGQASLAITKEFLKAGANVVLLMEESALPASDSSDFETWKSVLIPIANSTRFHQALPIIMPMGPWSVHTLDALPPGLCVCLPLCGKEDQAASPRTVGWTVELDGECRVLPKTGIFVTTAGEIPPDRDVADLRNACQQVRTALDRD